MITMQPIGIVHNARIAIEDDYWGAVISTIKLSEELFETTATLGLENFSHLEVIFYMDKVDDQKIQTGARHPRNNPELPLTGILAQRTKNRINKLGLSRAKIVSVNGLEIVVQGLDAIDQTPILDIKPVMNAFMPDQGAIVEPEWVHDIMANYYE